MLEGMKEFFDKRVGGYDGHMMKNIAFAEVFYPFTATLLPKEKNAEILDLGCGTGLELEAYFKLNSFARVTGIDLSDAMLAALQRKFTDKEIKLIQGSYFDVDFGRECFDAAVSVESLHHFTKEEKIPLYEKLYAALKPGGYFILTDYFAQAPEEERLFREEYMRLRQAEGITDGFYHYDTPLTVENEVAALFAGGFSSVEMLRSFGATATLRAVK